jgi:hypothetical protein
VRSAWPLFLLVAACGDDGAPPIDAGADASDAEVDASGPRRLAWEVLVTLDGEPAEGATITQGGALVSSSTDARGHATFTLDPTIDGPPWVMASHPDARIVGREIPWSAEGPIEIPLVRFSRSDNPDYDFQHPGTPDLRHNTGYCGHCHLTIDDDWFASPHRGSASNAVVQDVYAGVATALPTEEDCVAASGRWLEGMVPGTDMRAPRCYLGDGTLPDLNPECALETSSCDGVATRTGGCADCHAPGIDGELGGRDLLEARGISYDFGVHCDVCHKVESVDLAAAPGVAGRLRILRPSEPSLSPALGRFAPLTFAPYPDVMNPRMGSVAREVFHRADLCAGCHELAQEALVPGTAIDRDRWPDGRLPVQSTFSEWSDGPLAGAAPCQSCHMPPDAEVLNSADLTQELFAIGPAGGWVRPPGAVRRHIWAGPRQRAFGLFDLAASVRLETRLEGGEVVARVTVQNAGAGHAIPTGEPLRSMLLFVDARCGDERLVATGGDVIPDFGGAYATREGGEDWTVWPEASAGMVLRVIERGEPRDYDGFGPFGDRFAPEEKGMPVERWIGERTIVSVAPDGTVTLDAPLPSGDAVHLGDAAEAPVDGAGARALAGAPGFGFARVLVDAAGERMVPHHRAVDVASDNRLMPRASFTTEHRFAATCTEPEVGAVVVHRAYPFGLARERRWTLNDSIMASAWR